MRSLDIHGKCWLKGDKLLLIVLSWDVRNTVWWNRENRWLKASHPLVPRSSSDPKKSSRSVDPLDRLHVSKLLQMLKRGTLTSIFSHSATSNRDFVCPLVFSRPERATNSIMPLTSWLSVFLLRSDGFLGTNCNSWIIFSISLSAVKSAAEEKSKGIERLSIFQHLVWYTFIWKHRIEHIQKYVQLSDFPTSKRTAIFSSKELMLCWSSKKLKEVSRKR